MVKIPWEDACENVAYVTSASCGDVIASPSTGGIDVRVNVDFLITATKPQWIRTITNLSYDETSARDLSTIPSVTVKRITPEETLWALAKRYNSTLGLIAEANGLEGEPEIGQLVLIPKRR
jgi:FOG: LysM repeat